jgi:hypothetical protein
LFGRGGRILYMGPSKDVLPYFKDLGYECPTHQNPAGTSSISIKGKLHVTRVKLFQILVVTIDPHILITAF